MLAGAQSTGPGTGRGITSAQPMAAAPQHSSSQANLMASGQPSGTATQIIEERIKHQNGEISYR